MPYKSLHPTKSKLSKEQALIQYGEPLHFATNTMFLHLFKKVTAYLAFDLVLVLFGKKIKPLKKCVEAAVY